MTACHPRRVGSSLRCCCACLTCGWILGLPRDSCSSLCLLFSAEHNRNRHNRYPCPAAVPALLPADLLLPTWRPPLRCVLRACPGRSSLLPFADACAYNVLRTITFTCNCLQACHMLHLPPLRVACQTVYLRRLLNITRS